MSKKHKKNVFSAFVSLVGVHTGITSSTVGIKIYVIYRKLKSINQLKRKKEKAQQCNVISKN